jgi:hypothetical protein
MSPLLIGQSTARNQKPALGDGITFDFDADLQIDQRVIQFKLHLLAVTEMIKALPDRSASTLAPLAKVIKAAYQARAEAHSWRNIPNGLSGAELASRWVAHRTYVYLLSIGAEADWAWGTSGAASVLGPVDWIGGGRDVVSGA